MKIKVGNKVVSAFLIGKTKKGNFEFEWFDKKGRYNYTVVDIKSIVKKIGDIPHKPLRWFEKYHIKLKDYLTFPTKQIISKSIKEKKNANIYVGS